MRLASMVGVLGVKRDSALYGRLRAKFHTATRRFGRSTWSQFGEDIIIDCLLSGEIGHYVDVGAGHPVDGSNSYKFYRRGWSGVVIEANKELAQKFSRSRSRDTVINALAGSRSGSADFYEYDAWQFSTSNVDRLEELTSLGMTPREKSNLEVITLSELNLAFAVDRPTFLSIDVEGSDLEVLKGNDWGKFRPSLICVEEHASPLTQQSRIRQYLEPLGYSLSSYSVKTSFYLLMEDSINRRNKQSTQV